MKQKTITTYIAVDGAEFLPETECLSHEKDIRNRIECPSCRGLGSVDNDTHPWLPIKRSFMELDQQSCHPCFRCKGNGYVANRSDRPIHQP